MKYPNSNRTFQKRVSHANRGMDLEELINEANNYYLSNNIACIYKKYTPIGIIDVKEENGKKVITKAFFKEASTLDYNGVYKGYYIEFDAKKTNNSSSFPLSNISNHQIDHIKNIIYHHGVIFLIIEMNKTYFLLDGSMLIDFINNNQRKSIPFSFIKEKGINIKIKRNILNYIESLDILLGGNYE